jgi:hypothetical protein
MLAQLCDHFITHPRRVARRLLGKTKRELFRFGEPVERQRFDALLRYYPQANCVVKALPLNFSLIFQPRRKSAKEGR